MYRSVFARTVVRVFVPSLFVLLVDRSTKFCDPLSWSEDWPHSFCRRCRTNIGNIGRGVRKRECVFTSSAFKTRFCQFSASRLRSRCAELIYGFPRGPRHSWKFRSRRDAPLTTPYCHLTSKHFKGRRYGGTHPSSRGKFRQI